MTLPALPPPHVPHPYANPECCGVRTALRVFSYQCLTCGRPYPFLDEQGQGYVRWTERPRRRRRQEKHHAARNPEEL
jgi:hypothetical protein